MVAAVVALALVGGKRAPAQELYEGLSATSQNCWPSVEFDVGALNNLLSPLFPAGFYYKTFMWPRFRLYEGMIRALAGIGRVDATSRTPGSRQQFLNVELCVIGGGASTGA